jgi:hypothetical protein
VWHRHGFIALRLFSYTHTSITNTYRFLMWHFAREQQSTRNRRYDPICHTAARTQVFDGEQEAKVIALRLGPPPKGFANWTLRLLAEKVVELEIVPAVSHETLRRALKKTA